MGFQSTSGYLYSLKLTLACLLLPPFILVLLLALIPVVFYRWILSTLRPCLRPDLSGLVLHHTPGLMGQVTLGLPISCYNVVVRLKLEGPADLPGLKALFQHKFADVHHELRSYFYLWGGYWFWKPDPDFHIDHHVLLHESPVHTAKPDEINQVQVKWLDKPLPSKRAQWQILVVNEESEGADSSSSQSHYLLIKFHHALADGFSIFQGLVKCTDEESLVGVKPPPRATPPISHFDRIPASALRKGFHRLTAALSYPFRFIHELARLICIERPALPWSNRPEPEFTARRVHVAVSDRHGGLDVRRIKGVAKEHGVSFTAAQLAALTGGVRAHLLGDRGYKVQDLPKEIVYPCPIPVPNHPQGMANYFYMITLRLPIGTPNRSKRLQRIEAMLHDRKRSLEPIVTCTAASLFSLLPAACLCVPFTFSFVMTNFPGPVIPVRINGSRVLDMNTSLIPHVIGLYIGFLSYNGWMTATFSGETTLFPGGVAELNRLAVHVADELDALEAIDIEVLDCN